MYSICFCIVPRHNKKLKVNINKTEFKHFSQALLLMARNCSYPVKQTSEPLLFQTPPPLNVFTNSVPCSSERGYPPWQHLSPSEQLYEWEVFSHFLSAFHMAIMTRAGVKESGLDNVSASHQESLSASIRGNCLRNLPQFEPGPYNVYVCFVCALWTISLGLVDFLWNKLIFFFIKETLN